MFFIPFTLKILLSRTILFTIVFVTIVTHQKCFYIIFIINRVMKLHYEHKILDRYTQEYFLNYSRSRNSRLERLTFPFKVRYWGQLVNMFVLLFPSQNYGIYMFILIESLQFRSVVLNEIRRNCGRNILQVLLAIIKIMFTLTLKGRIV